MLVDHNGCQRVVEGVMYGHTGSPPSGALVGPPITMMVMVTVA